jgi:hypothetical protein
MWSVLASVLMVVSQPGELIRTPNGQALFLVRMIVDLQENPVMAPSSKECLKCLLRNYPHTPVGRFVRVGICP